MSDKVSQHCTLTEEEVIEICTTCVSAIVRGSNGAHDLFAITEQVLINLANFMTSVDTQFEGTSSSHKKCMRGFLHELFSDAVDTVDTGSGMGSMYEKCIQMHAVNGAAGETVQ